MFDVVYLASVSEHSTIEVSIDELFVCFDALKWIDIKGGNDD